MNKVFVLPPNENWIIDRFVKEWNENNADISVTSPYQADVIWLLADFCWKHIPLDLLLSKKVITTVHHIVPEKFDHKAREDFFERDLVTTVYHVYNQKVFDFIKPLTTKPIYLIKYWANNFLFRQTQHNELVTDVTKHLSVKQILRQKYNLPIESFLLGSFQRDTEGSDLKSPKLEKGPDLFVDFVETKWKEWWNTDMRVFGEPRKPHVVLAGWRRQYVINRFKKAEIPYTYFELPSQDKINELYQTLDLYPITARCEGGPQALIECGLLNVPVVSRNVGIADQVLPASAINDDVSLATPAVPDVDSWKLPGGFYEYRKLIGVM